MTSSVSMVLPSAPAWLGHIPAHWSVRRLKYLVAFSGGGTPSKAEPSFWGGDIPWVSPKDMKSEVIADSADHITEAAVRASATRIVPAGSVLLVVRSGILRHTIPVAITARPVALNQDMKALIPSGECERRYLKYVIQGRQHVLLHAWTRTGATVESIEHDLVADTLFPVPPIEEQRDIADRLDEKTVTIDTLIAKRERHVELLKEKRHALIVERALRGIDPEPPVRDSGTGWMGEIPAHWRVARIKHVARLESGHTPDRKVPEYWQEGSIPWVSLKDTKTLASTDYISDTAECTTSAGLANSSARLLPAGTVVFTRDATIGLAAIATRPMAVSQHLIGWVCGGELLPEYLLRVIDAMRDELDRLTFGATIKTIGMDDVKELTTPLPPVEEQRAIISAIRIQLERHDALISRLRAQIEQLREYRQTLISAAVTGQLPVREEVPA